MNNNKKTKKRFSLIITLLIVIAGAIAYWQYSSNNSAPPVSKDTPTANTPNRSTAGSRRPPMPPVQVATSAQEDVPQFLTALGTVKAVNSVTVTSRVEGQLMALHFTEGQQVNQGDLLAEIDPRPFEVQLAQAKGQLAKDQATLANARLDLARYQKLAKTHLVSQQELDNQAALVKQSEASISIDKAAINNAQLQLTYSKITAPISGRVGLKQVDVGNYISGGSSTPIVVINQMDPVDVLFTLPEQDLSQVILARKNSPTLPVIAFIPSPMTRDMKTAFADFEYGEKSVASSLFALMYLVWNIEGDDGYAMVIRRFLDSNETYASGIRTALHWE